ncbi:MAG: EAL domain-containing protein, partial [Deltaproteobacteria bacterium]|nr:EAL domain-containing protein [Deltaproteobacteria bacterium]
ILKKMGPLLKSVVHESVSVVRMGGNEFALLLSEIDGVAQAIETTQEISAALETPFMVDGNPIQMEASFGIAVFPEHGQDADTLIKLADVALYLAKGLTSGYSVYAPELDRHSLRQLILLGELRLAIEHEEMVFFYQPKVNLVTGRIIGVEALLRWEHPQHGFIPPDEFIPILEGTGLIKPLTMWTFKAAFSQCAQFNAMGIKLDMAVNLSARMLQDHRVTDLVTDMIESFHLPPEQIIVEITESAIMADPKKTS